MHFLIFICCLFYITFYIDRVDSAENDSIHGIFQGATGFAVEGIKLHAKKDGPGIMA